MSYSKRQVRQAWIRRRRRRGEKKEPAPPAFTVSPYIVPMAGPYYTGQQLTCQYMASGFPTPTPTYQWRNGTTPIAGATSATYTPTAPSTDLNCQVSLTNSEGGPVVDTTPNITVVQSVLPAQTTPPVIGPSGNQPSGTVLTYDIPGVWTGPPGSGEPGFNVTFDWYRDGTIIGGTTGQASYDTIGFDGTYTVRERASNYAGGPILGAPSNAIEVGAPVTDTAMATPMGLPMTM